MTDAAQSITDSYTYYAYGGSAGSASSTANPFRWVGQIGYCLDSDLAQYYVRARHYTPNSVRWLSQDPIGYSSGDANFYRYAGNSPMSALDPIGTIGLFHAWGSVGVWWECDGSSKTSWGGVNKVELILDATTADFCTWIGRPYSHAEITHRHFYGLTSTTTGPTKILQPNLNCPNCHMECFEYSASATWSFHIRFVGNMLMSTVRMTVCADTSVTTSHSSTKNVTPSYMSYAFIAHDY